MGRLADGRIDGAVRRLGSQAAEPGLSDHEVAAVLGLAHVRSVDRLLRHRAELDAQHLVRETLTL